MGTRAVVVIFYETTSFPRRKSLRRFPRRRRKFRNISAVILRRSFPRLNRSVIPLLQNTIMTLSRYHLCRARRKYHNNSQPLCAALNWAFYPFGYVSLRRRYYTIRDFLCFRRLRCANASPHAIFFLLFYSETYVLRAQTHNRVIIKYYIFYFMSFLSDRS